MDDAVCAAMTGCLPESQQWLKRLSGVHEAFGAKSRKTCEHRQLVVHGKTSAVH